MNLIMGGLMKISEKGIEWMDKKEQKHYLTIEITKQMEEYLNSQSFEDRIIKLSDNVPNFYQWIKEMKEDGFSYDQIISLHLKVLLEASYRDTIRKIEEDDFL